jgi:(+)-abscisic acid 8'-hydroxylase
MQARQRLGAVLSGILAERRARRSDDDDDHGLLNALMRSRDDSGAAPPLSDDQIADNVIGVLFAAQDTTASVLTWILKFLHDNPKLLEAVKVRARASQPRRSEGRHRTFRATILF